MDGRFGVLVLSVVYFATVIAGAVDPIIHLIPACPLTTDGLTVVDLKVDVPAYGLARCQNGEKFLQNVSSVEFTINGTFAQEYHGDYCQFKKKAGTNAFTLDVEVGWGNFHRDLMTNRRQYVVTCAFDSHGTVLGEKATIAEWYIAPKETQVLMGKEHSSAVFEMKLIDISDDEITATEIPLGKRVRLKITETNSSSAIGCPAGFDMIGQSCYYISLRPDSWSFSSADDFCLSLGAEMVAFESEEEFDAIRNHFDKYLIMGSFMTSGMIIGPSTAYWTTSGEFVSTSSYYWLPGYSLGTANYECIALEAMWGDFGLMDWNCREQRDRNVFCELKDTSLLDVTQKVDSFKALSCDVKNSLTSYAILRAGCGDGIVFNKTAGFISQGDVVYSPYFEAFRLPGGDVLQFQCTVTVCETPCDGRTASRRRNNEMQCFPTRLSELWTQANRFHMPNMFTSELNATP